jgi:hypothetical protein
MIPSHVLESVPTERKHEEFTVVLEKRYGDHQLVEAFHAQLRRRVLHSGGFPAVDNLSHLTYAALTQQHISRQASRNLRRQLLFRGKRALSEGHKQTH